MTDAMWSPAVGAELTAPPPSPAGGAAPGGPAPGGVGPAPGGPGPVPGPADPARAALSRLRAEVAKAVVGQEGTVTGLVIALLCRGHVLLEGVPGVAKTFSCVPSRQRSTWTRSGCSSRRT